MLTSGASLTARLKFTIRSWSCGVVDGHVSVAGRTARSSCTQRSCCEPLGGTLSTRCGEIDLQEFLPFENVQCWLGSWPFRFGARRCEYLGGEAHMDSYIFQVTVCVEGGTRGFFKHINHCVVQSGAISMEIPCPFLTQGRRWTYPDLHRRRISCLKGCVEASPHVTVATPVRGGIFKLFCPAFLTQCCLSCPRPRNESPAQEPPDTRLLGGVCPTSSPEVLVRSATSVKRGGEACAGIHLRLPLGGGELCDFGVA